MNTRRLITVKTATIAVLMLMTAATALAQQRPPVEVAEIISGDTIVTASGKRMSIDALEAPDSEPGASQAEQYLRSHVETAGGMLERSFFRPETLAPAQFFEGVKQGLYYIENVPDYRFIGSWVALYDRGSGQDVENHPRASTQGGTEGDNP
jgi:hypothetical protein